MRRFQGFTLIELMIAMAIIAILASIAIPTYNGYVRRGKTTEATSTLADLRVRLERYYADQTPPSYDNDGACGVAMPNTPAVKYFTYACVTDGQTFTITATGEDDEGMDGYIYTINHTNAKSSTLPDGGTANCWRTKPDESC